MSNTRLSVAARDAANDAQLALADGGFLRIYSGTQRATPNDSIGSSVLLSEMGLGTPAAAPSSGGVALFNAISPDTSADNTGVASWCAIVAADGVSPVFDGDVGVGPGFNLKLASTTIVAGAIITATSLSFTTPMQGA